MSQRKLLIALIITLFSDGICFGDAVDDAEAKSRGITVEQVLLERKVITMQDQITKDQQTISALQKQVADLQTSTKSKLIATQPTTLDAKHSNDVYDFIETKYNSLPKNLWPASNEQEIVIQARNKWYVDNIKSPIVGPFHITGTMLTVQESYPSIQQKVILVSMSTPNRAIWGQHFTVYVALSLKNVTMDEAALWKAGRAISATVQIDAMPRPFTTTMVPSGKVVVAEPIHLTLSGTLDK